MQTIINQVRAAIAEGYEFKSIELAYSVEIRVIGMSLIAIIADQWSVAIEI